MSDTTHPAIAQRGLFAQPPAWWHARPWARRCVLVVSDANGNDPPAALADAWDGVRVDVLILAATDQPKPAQVAKWAKFCKEHGGVAVPLPSSLVTDYPDTVARILSGLIEPH